MYLLETNVISELRKTRAGKSDPGVRTWAESVDAASMYLSVVSLLELELGVLLMERRDPVQGSQLRSWLEKQVRPAFAGRILAIDEPVAQRCAALHVPNPCSYRDSLIAATALVHGLIVVTRNTADFKSAEVAVLNPWQN